MGFWDICAHLIWPVSCPMCGAVGTIACETCLNALFKRLPLPTCLFCGIPIPCETHGSGSAKIRAGALHEGLVRDVILMLKYGKHEALAFQLGKALGRVFARPDVDFLVPVPLHLKSKRPYNQAEAIAGGLGDVWDIEVSNAARWALDVPTRAGMRRRERLALSSEAFAFDEGLSGRRVSLVDDVSTTGTTLICLAETASEAGVEVAGAFVVAHAVGAQGASS